MSCQDQNLFNRLPLELQQMVLHQALTKQGSDVIIDIDQDGSLQAPGLLVLQKLKSVDTKMHEIAIDYFSNLLRIVFQSVGQPHRAVLRAFRQHTTSELRSAIKRVYLSDLTFAGLVAPESLFRTNSISFFRFPYSGGHHSPYIIRKVQETDEDFDRFGNAVQHDMRVGLVLLLATFPSLQHLDIGVDLVECLAETSGHWSLSDSIGSFREQPVLRKSRIRQLLSSIASFPNIATIQVRILWDDFIEREENFQTDIALTEELRCDLQERVLESLRRNIPAMSITGHSLRS